LEGFFLKREKKFLKIILYLRSIDEWEIKYWVIVRLTFEVSLTRIIPLQTSRLRFRKKGLLTFKVSTFI